MVCQEHLVFMNLKYCLKISTLLRSMNKTMATLVKKEPHRLASIATVRDEDPASAGLHHLLTGISICHFPVFFGTTKN